MLLVAIAWAALLGRDQPTLQTASAMALAVALLAAMNSAYGLHSTARTMPREGLDQKVEVIGPGASWLLPTLNAAPTDELVLHVPDMPGSTNCMHTAAHTGRQLPQRLHLRYCSSSNPEPARMSARIGLS